MQHNAHAPIKRRLLKERTLVFVHNKDRLIPEMQPRHFDILAGVIPDDRSIRLVIDMWALRENISQYWNVPRTF